MARSFPNTTDFMRYSGTFPSPVKVSVCFWVKNPNLNDFYTYVRNDSLSLNLAGNTAGTNRIELTMGRSTTAGVWNIDQATHGMTLANWNHFAWTYDGSSTSNNALFYANGVLKTVTRATAPVGTQTTSAGNLYLGRWENASRNIGGSMAYVNVHDDVLTAQEVLDSMNYGTCPRNRIGDWSTIGQASPDLDYSGNGRNMVITNTTVTADPPGILQPRPPLRRLQAVMGSAVR